MDIRRARYLRKNSTDAERRLWRELRRHQLDGYKFRRQQVIGPYIVDFVCLELKLVIEIDGGQHQLQNQYDDRRTRWLESAGYQVIRFWNHDVLRNIETVTETIHTGLEDMTAEETGVKLK